MKTRILSAVSAFVFICNAGFEMPVGAENKIEHKQYSVTVTSSSDGAAIVKVSAQYMFNEAQRMCKCLDLSYDILRKDKGYNVKVDLCRSNLSSDCGGAYALITTRRPRGKAEKLALKMRFLHTGEASHSLERVN